MNLSEMTIEDVRALIARLQYLVEPAERLRELGEEPVIRMMPGEPVVITAGVAVPAAVEFGAPPEFVVEPAEAVGPDLLRFRAATAAEAVEAVAAPAPALVPLKSGPLAADERVQIFALHAQGVEPREIAARIGRRLQQVASSLASTKSKPTGQPVPAGNPTPAKATLISSPVVADAIPEAPAAGAEVPPADTGQPAREREAGATAPEAGGAAPDLSFDQRRINAWLGGLGYRKGWSAQADHDLVDALGRGLKFPEACADLGYDPRDAKARWDEMTHTLRDSRGHVTLEGQANLLAVLRYRLGGV